MKTALAAHHPRVQPEVKPRLWQAVAQQISSAIPRTLAGALRLKPDAEYRAAICAHLS